MSLNAELGGGEHIQPQRQLPAAWAGPLILRCCRDLRRPTHPQGPSLKCLGQGMSFSYFQLCALEYNPFGTPFLSELPIKVRTVSHSCQVYCTFSPHTCSRHLWCSFLTLHVLSQHSDLVSSVCFWESWSLLCPSPITLFTSPLLIFSQFLSLN